MAGCEISVVIAALNASPYLSELFEAFDAQTLEGSRYEVVIVDDGSTDDTSALLAAWAADRPSARRVVRGGGCGPAHARNLGVAAARGTWIAFTDADVLPPPEWLERMLHVSEKAHAVAVEGSVVPWPREALRANTHPPVNEIGGLFMTANMGYRRDLFERLGGFDERFTDACVEDADLAFRVLDAGYDIPFAREVVVRHRVIPSSPRELLASTRRLRWLGLLAHKHPTRYRAHRRRYVRPLTRPDLYLAAGVGGAAAAVVARGPLRLAGLALAANGIRVLVGSGRLNVPRAQVPAQAFAALAMPFWKTFWWVEGLVRFR